MKKPPSGKARTDGTQPKQVQLGALHGYAQGFDLSKGHKKMAETPTDDNPMFDDNRYNLKKVT